MDYQGTIAQILELNKKATMGLTALNEAVPTLKHEFLKEAVAMVAAGILTEREVRHVLEQRLKTIETRYLHEANMFRTIGKFPPAFGLLADHPRHDRGSPEDWPGRQSEADSGPAMSVGLIGTLYGIALANLVFLPIAENLTERTHEEITLRKMIIENTVMLKQQVNPITLREGLNSFLLPRDRVTKKAA